MSKKLTQEYIKNYFDSFGYKLLSLYKNNSTRLILLEKNSKYLYYTTYASFKETNKSYFVHKSNIFSLYNIKLFIRKNRHKYTNGRIPILKNGQKYKNATTNMIWICSNCVNEFSTSFDQISHFHSCPFCSSPPKQIKVGFNDLACTVWLRAQPHQEKQFWQGLAIFVPAWLQFPAGVFLQVQVLSAPAIITC